MALELLMADYGDIADYGEEKEEEEESNLLAEAKQQGNMLEIVVYEENTPLEVPEENMLEMVVYEENTPLEVPEENMLEIVVYEEKSALEEVPEKMTNEIEERKTISVELAMQRELDYYNKIKEMKKEIPGYDYEELSMPVQGEPSNLELWEIDRRTPSDRFSNTQGETSDSVDFEKKIMKDEIRDKTDVAEMANESVKGNIMPVELAIQRELAYQKKIEGMQLQPCYDFVERSMCVQGEPSNLELREIDRRPSSDSFLNTQGEMSDPIVSAKKIIKEEIRDATDIAEMANESVKGNITPVELAYQKKIEGIQLQPSYDFVKPPVADQETHSIRIPSEMNAKPRSSRSPCFKDQATTEKAILKTMSVELALQREIEYQAKVKRLKLEADNDFREAPQPTTRGTTSHLELRNMNRESCFQNSSSLSGRIPNPIFFRGEVQRERSQQQITRREMSNERDRSTTMPAELAIQRKLEVQRKMQNLQSGFKFQKGPVPPQGSTPNQNIAINQGYPLPRKVKQQYYQKNPLFCRDCGVLCSSAKTLKMHYRGKRHATVVMLKRNNNVTGARELVCEVCLVPCTDEDSLQRHLSGKKHAANVEKLAEAVCR